MLQAQLASIAALKKRDIICPYVFHRADGAQIRDMRGVWEAARTAMAMVGHETESIYAVCDRR